MWFFFCTGIIHVKIRILKKNKFLRPRPRPLLTRPRPRPPETNAHGVFNF